MTEQRIILCVRPVIGHESGTLVIDHGRRLIVKDGGVFRGSPLGIRRFRLLSGLLARAPSMIEWDDLVEHIWGSDGWSVAPKHYIYVMLGHEREHLRWLGYSCVTVWGRGLRLELSPAESARAA